VVLEQSFALLVYLVPDLISILVLPSGFEIMVPSWAIFNALAQLISSFALERYVVLH